MSIKSLSSYAEAAKTEALNKHGAFFAFNKEQVEEGMQEHGHTDKSVLCSIGSMGLICPKDNAAQLVEDIAAAHGAGIQLDKAENSAQDIIIRELFNHECQITMDQTDAREALSGYGFTDAEYAAAWGVFYQRCIDEDCF